MFVDPGWNNMSQLNDNSAVRQSLRPYGRSALYKQAFFDNITGEVKRNGLYTYGLDRDFFLGDRVALEVGGRRQYARIKEYTFSWTIENGFIGYPTLDSSPVGDTFM